MSVKLHSTDWHKHFRIYFFYDKYAEIVVVFCPWLHQRSFGDIKLELNGGGGVLSLILTTSQYFAICFIPDHVLFICSKHLKSYFQFKSEKDTNKVILDGTN